MMNRPPPLRLQREQDNTRVYHSPAPGPETPRSLPGRIIHALYTRNWRRVVIVAAVLNTFRFGVHVTQAYQDYHVDLAQNMPGLATTSLSVCGMYFLAVCIESYGIYCACVQRVSLVRIYTILSFAAALLVCAAGLTNMLNFFTFKNEILDECAKLSMAGQLSTKSMFTSDHWPGNAPGSTISPYDAKPGCLKGWESSSTSQLTTFILVYILPSIFVFLIPFAYYRQLINPAHPHAAPATHSAIPLTAYPAAAGINQGYSPLYNSAGSLNPRHHNNSNRNGNSNAQGRGLEATTITPRRSRSPAPPPLFEIGTATSEFTPGPGPPSFGVGGAGAYPPSSYNVGPAELPAYSASGDYDKFV